MCHIKKRPLYMSARNTILKATMAGSKASSRSFYRSKTPHTLPLPPCGKPG
uniref:Uncharacterized protein n=1 Tax=Anguilla anguilla TaxID=7936 RepID=A0A0E9XQB0_ANGAN